MAIRIDAVVAAEQGCRAVIDNRVPAFLRLTVTGGLSLSPTDPHEQLLSAAFNDHQRRAGGAGPEATTLTVNLLRAAEFAVTTQETPWRLTAKSGMAFVDQMLDERLAAAVAQDPALAGTAAAWLELRRPADCWAAADRARPLRHSRSPGRTLGRVVSRRSRTQCRGHGPG